MLSRPIATFLFILSVAVQDAVFTPLLSQKYSFYSFYICSIFFFYIKIVSSWGILHPVSLHIFLSVIYFYAWLLYLSSYLSTHVCIGSPSVGSSFYFLTICLTDSYVCYLFLSLFLPLFIWNNVISASFKIFQFHYLTTYKMLYFFLPTIKYFIIA